MVKLTILQAYEADHVPEWIAICLQSVKAWAGARGHDYHFTPRFFAAAPKWFRERCGPQTGPMTDMCRLMLMRERCAAGIESAVWIDADVLIFDPDAFLPEPPAAFFGINEILATMGADSIPVCGPRTINGAVLGARCGDPSFDAYFQAVETVVRNHSGSDIPRTIAGPQLLTRLAQNIPIASLDNVGLLTPMMFDHVDRRIDIMIAAYMRAMGHRLAAANLCHFIRAEPGTNVAMFDELLRLACLWLLRTRGSAFNRYIA